VPLLVLLVVKGLNPREMEASLAEHVVARVCIGRQRRLHPQMRDHANLARAYAALGQAGIDEINGLMLHVAKDCGLADLGLLSSATTAQEWPIGEPNEPSLLRGWAQRCGRALAKLTGRGVLGVGSALEQVQTSLRSVKEHHLFAKGQAEKQPLLTRILREVGQLVGLTRPLGERLGHSCDRLTQPALATLGAMHEVSTQLRPQMVQWITTGVVAKGKIWPAGMTQARAIVRNKAGKKVEFGLPYLRSRLGGGEVFGTMIQGGLAETKRPWQALRGSRTIFGPEAPPKLVGYDRGGGVKRTMDQRAQEGVEQVGVQPKGKQPWRVAEAVREQVRSARGKTEGIIGTLKNDKYKCNTPKERLWQTLEMAGPRWLLSFNLNKLMRDVVQAAK
jgi:DNA-binding FrmR family transcriptional regulator